MSCSSCRRLFEVFRKFCTSAEDCVDIHEFLMANRTRPSFFSKCFRCRYFIAFLLRKSINYCLHFSCFSKKQSQCYPSNLFEAYIFQQYTSNNWLNFEQFVISLWAFLATSNDLLYAYCFNMLDVSRQEHQLISQKLLLCSYL